MRNRIKDLYESALNDKKFNEMILTADGDKKPTVTSTNFEKAIYASIYYGWLIAKYGKDWTKHIVN